MSPHGSGTAPDAYPPADRLPIVERLPLADPTYDVADPYRWLENATTEQTRAWSLAQDELVEVHRTRWAGRDHLRARVEQLLAAGMVSTPTWRRERQFLMRQLPGQEHAVLLTIDPDGTERVLLDPMTLDGTGATTLDLWEPSTEGQLLAYQLSVGGREESMLHVMDVLTGADVDGLIDRTRYSPVAWLPGGDAFYYERRLDPASLPAEEQQYHRRLWLHRVGSDPVEDAMIFGDGLAMTSYYGLSISLDGQWLVVDAAEGAAHRYDLWIADLGAGPVDAPAFQVVHEGLDAQTAVHVGRDGRAYVFTDLDAPRGRLAVTDPTRPGVEHWTDLLPQSAEAVLDGYVVLDGAELDSPLLLASWTRHAVSEITVHDLATGERLDEVPLPGVGSVGGLSAHPEGGHEAWIGYTDSVTPSSVLQYDGRTGDTTTWATAPGLVDVPEVSAQQLVYQSSDGTDVRLLVVSPEAGPDRQRPTILYGYGGFGAAMTPAYSAAILAWVEAGGVYAVAALRGGGEEGEDWHRDGMLGAKQNVFDDFHAAAEFLVQQGWTTPEQLAISGASNGGLLVGAAITQRPDLFAAAVCSAPLLDMVRYELFGLGATWASEYGTAGDRQQLGWLLGYSPYHHVTEGTRYPAVLFTVFDGDTRVDPLHARKLAAALQYATSGPVDQAPVLLRREHDVGHGARALSRSVELMADTLAFAAHHTGLDLPSAAEGA